MALKHPAYFTMVSQAIADLNEKKGSSRQRILMFIMTHYQVGQDTTKVNRYMKVALLKGVQQGVISQTSGSGASGRFKLQKESLQPPKDTLKSTKPKNAKPAADDKQPSTSQQPKKKATTKKKLVPPPKLNKTYELYGDDSDTSLASLESQPKTKTKPKNQATSSKSGTASSKASTKPSKTGTKPRKSIAKPSKSSAKPRKSIAKPSKAGAKLSESDTKLSKRGRKSSSSKQPPARATRNKPAKPTRPTKKATGNDKKK